MSSTADVTCPFCGLLCDDLTVKSTGPSGLQVTAGGCPRAAAGFGQPAADADGAWIGGRAATTEDAIAGAAALLRSSRQPLIAGMATDVDGCRSALALAERVGAVVDHMHGDAIAAGTSVLQRRGWTMTTLTELKNRADVVLLFGTDGDSVCPRFSERCLSPSVGLAAAPATERKVIFVGPRAAAQGLRGKLPDLIVAPCAPADYLSFLWALHAAVTGRELPGRPNRSIDTVAATLKEAAYAAVVWSAVHLPSGAEDIAIEALCDIVSSLNEHTRAAGLALGGGDGAVTALNVCAWQTGYPLRVSFSAGGPVFDPALNSTARLTATGGADLLVWISAFAPMAPPDVDIPVIALTPPSRKISRTADIHLPVAIPGVESAGTLFRLDSVVSLPLRKLRSSPLATTSEALKRIIELI